MVAGRAAIARPSVHTRSSGFDSAAQICSSALLAEYSLPVKKDETIQSCQEENTKKSTFHAQSKMMNEAHVYASDGLAFGAGLAVPGDGLVHVHSDSTRGCTRQIAVAYFHHAVCIPLRGGEQQLAQE